MLNAFSFQTKCTSILFLCNSEASHYFDILSCYPLLYRFNFPRDKIRHHCPSIPTVLLSPPATFISHILAFVKNNQSRVASVLFNLQKKTLLNLRIFQQLPNRLHCPPTTTSIQGFKSHPPLARQFNPYVDNNRRRRSERMDSFWCAEYSSMHCLIAVVVDYYDL